MAPPVDNGNSRASLSAARLGSSIAAELRSFAEDTLKPDQLARLFPAGVFVDVAHTVMLTEAEIHREEHGGKLLAVLSEILEAGVARFPFDPKRGGGSYSQVEGFLGEHLGSDIAGRLHIGRSRIDRSATVNRLIARDDSLSVIECLLNFQQAILDVAEQHTETVMPGYTHLQHAQPWTFGHYLSSYLDRFSRDVQRLRGAYARTNLCPLGTAALGGTSWPLDRARTSELLGFDGIVRNSKDAGEFYKDYNLELVSALAMLMSGVGHMANELYIWHSYEFGLVELADEYAETSSIMPQKKNPHALDIIKSVSGYIIGLPATEFSKQRMCTSSDLDDAFAPDVVPAAAALVCKALSLFRGAISTLRVNTRRMRQLSGEYWGTVVHLADQLTRERGLSFRASHAVCGRLVRLAVQRGIDPQSVTGALLDEAAIETLGRPLECDTAFVLNALAPEKFVWSRVTRGSVNPVEVKRMLAEQRAELGENQHWLGDSTERVRSALELLRSRARELSLSAE